MPFIYTVPFAATLPSVVDTAKTLAAITVGAGPGDRARLVSVSAGFYAPTQLTGYVEYRIIRATSVTTAGTPGSSIPAASMPRGNQNHPDPPFSAGIDYSVEPTVFEANPLFVLPLTECLVPFPADDPPIVVITNGMLALQARVPGSAELSAPVSGVLEFEYF